MRHGRAGGLKVKAVGFTELRTSTLQYALIPYIAVHTNTDHGVQLGNDFWLHVRRSTRPYSSMY